MPCSSKFPKVVRKFLGHPMAPEAPPPPPERLFVIITTSSSTVSSPAPSEKESPPKMCYTRRQQEDRYEKKPVGQTPKKQASLPRQFYEMIKGKLWKTSDKTLALAEVLAQAPPASHVEAQQAQATRPTYASSSVYSDNWEKNWPDDNSSVAMSIEGSRPVQGTEWLGC